MSIRVKICGIISMEDASVAFEGGADAVGFIFYRKSLRYITPLAASRIVEGLGPFITTVGVFVNESPEEIKAAISISGIDCVQLHGEEGPRDCLGYGLDVIKAIRVRDSSDIERLEDFRVSAYLLDTYREGMHGGTGEAFDWDIAVEAKRSGRVILSGGLDPDNVGEAVRRVRPYAVDVSSGVESAPGRKDPDRVLRFIKEARAASADRGRE
ncbi:MAG: phosphoribosylanthranilate isomerase [Deltaproteobacteria bacterium]|nr:phosphoribosylanthranilate isomerase [Deltaproteobacteria bacterium]